MIGYKEHTDSILFLKSKITTLKKQIIRSHKETVHFINDKPSAIHSSKKCLGLQYDLECSETVLKVIELSLIQSKAIDNVIDHLKSIVESVYTEINELIEQCEQDEECVIDMDEYEASIKSLESVIPVYTGIMDALNKDNREAI